ncbi:MAG: VOC family protein [Thermoleophilaceae bacterium]
MELLVSNLAASIEHFTEIMGLQLSAQEGDRAYLRAWQDRDHHTLVLTEAPESGLGHVGWRVETRAEVEEIERDLNARGIATSWGDAHEGRGHGEGLRFLTPGGLPFELYWEVEYFVAPPERASRFPSHPSRIGTRGIVPRRFDHVTLGVLDPRAEQEFLTDALGIQHRYYGEAPDGSRIGSWMSRTNIAHEIAVGRLGATDGPALHHLAYYAESPDSLLNGASMLVDQGYKLDFGPARHGTSSATALYWKEPSGNRIEVWTGGLLIFDPDWEATRWDGDLILAGIGDEWGTSQMSEDFISGTIVSRDLMAGAKT